jgi:hypothetical protein
MGLVDMLALEGISLNPSASVPRSTICSTDIAKKCALLFLFYSWPGPQTFHLVGSNTIHHDRFDDIATPTLHQKPVSTCLLPTLSEQHLSRSPPVAALKL